MCIKYKDELQATWLGDIHGTTKGPEMKAAEQKTHNLELDSLALKLDGTNLEIYANCTDIALRVRIVRKPKKQTRLARN